MLRCVLLPQLSSSAWEDAMLVDGMHFETCHPAALAQEEVEAGTKGRRWGNL